MGIVADTSGEIVSKEAIQGYYSLFHPTLEELRGAISPYGNGFVEVDPSHGGVGGILTPASGEERFSVPVCMTRAFIHQGNNTDIRFGQITPDAELHTGELRRAIALLFQHEVRLSSLSRNVISVAFIPEPILAGNFTVHPSQQRTTRAAMSLLQQAIDLGLKDWRTNPDFKFCLLSGDGSLVQQSPEFFLEGVEELTIGTNPYFFN